MLALVRLLLNLWVASYVLF